MTLHVPRLPFSLDPLIAEAKRRARQRRVLVALVLAVVVAAGAVLGFELRGLGAVAAPVPANLTVLAVAQDSGALGLKGGRALFHLRCDPAGGNVAQPAKACAAIAAQPSLVTNPKRSLEWPIDTVGFATTFWYITITGRLNGRPVHFNGESPWTTQIALIDKLGLASPHGQPLRLEPLRHGFVGMNQTHRFAPGVLRPGDVVACRVHHSYRGPPLAMGVPPHRGVGPYGDSSTPGVMAVQVRADGAVIASCLARDRLPLDKRGRTTFRAGWPP
jgi:hypothetical protein